MSQRGNRVDSAVLAGDLMYLYVKTTSDKYEFPIAVAENVRDLMELTGMKESSARSLIWKLKKGKYRCSGWHLVEVEDDG